MDWKYSKNELISGSEDGQICLFDLEKKPIENLKTKTAVLLPTFKFNINHQSINDIKFHKN